MSTKPKQVVLAWKYRNESFAQWREGKMVEADYGTDIDGGISGIQNQGIFTGPPFDPKNERVDVVAIPVSAANRRIPARLMTLGPSTPLVNSGGVNATEVAFEVTEPTTAGDFSVNDFIKIDDELLQITAIVEDSPSAGKDTWTVRRGEHATSGAAHTINTQIYRQEWTVQKGYKQIILAGTPETGLPGTPDSLIATAFSDALGNAVQVTVKRPDTGSKTLRHLEIQAKTSPVWDDSNEHVTGLKTIRTTGTGTVSQGGSTLVTSTDLTAASVVAGDECYTHEALNLTTGQITWPRSARIKTVVDNGDSTWTITLIDDATFSLSSGDSGTVNFIAAADWQAVPGDFEFWETISIPERWTQVATDPLTGSTRVVVRTSDTIYIRARWHNLNGTGSWFYWDGSTGTTTKGSATTIAVNLIQSGGIADDSITAVKLTENSMNWNTDIVFSAASNVQVNWTSGTLTFSDASSFSIVSGNTGSMAALTYIYFDPDASTTVLQTSTTLATAVGDRKTILAVGKNGPAGESAFFVPVVGTFGFNSANVGLLSIATGSLQANSVTAVKINVVTLDAISANVGTLTSGNITGLTITGGTVQTASSGQRVRMLGGAVDRITWTNSSAVDRGIIQYDNSINTFFITHNNANTTQPLRLTANTTAYNFYTNRLDIAGVNITDVGDIALDSITAVVGNIAVNDIFDMNGNGLLDVGDIACDSLSAAASTITVADDLIPSSASLGSSGSRWTAIFGVSMNLSGGATLGDSSSDVVVFNARIQSNIVPSTNNARALGTSSLKWSDVQAVLIQGADIGLANGWKFREYPCTAEDVQTQDHEWFRENSNLGIQIRDEDEQLIAVIHKDGYIYCKGVKTLEEL